MNDKHSSFLANHKTRPRRVLILAYEGAQLLDLTGPATVFAEAAEFCGAKPYEVVIASSTGGLVTTSSGVVLATNLIGARNRSAVDTFLVPGGTPGSLERVMRDGTLQKYAVAVASRAKRIASVCTGAFVLAAWGLLDGRRVATHWAAAAQLTSRFPAVSVDPYAIFVQDGHIWTAAGVSTGIDMALALIEEDLGRTVASNVARRLVLPMRRAGHQSQFAAMLDAQDGSFANLTTWIAENLAADLSLEALAERAGQAPRTLHRRFTAALGMTPAAFVEQLRLERARALLELGQTAKQVAMTVGFGSQDRLGRAFRREYNLTPTMYRAVHGQQSKHAATGRRLNGRPSMV